VRCLIIADTENWAFANRARALVRHAPDDLCMDVTYYDAGHLDYVVWSLYDVILCLPPNILSSLRRVLVSSGCSVPIVACHNSGIGRRRDTFYESLLSSEYVIVNNYGAWQNFRLSMDPCHFRACHISNGLDRAIFRVNRRLESRPDKVIWVASRQKMDAEDVKGIDVLGSLAVLLPNMGFQTDFRWVDSGAGRTPEQMSDWYNSAGYVVCTSRSEGTPNYLLEAAACGCVPISPPVGNVPEIVRSGVSGAVVTRRTASYAKAFKRCRKNRLEMARRIAGSFAGWDWSERAEWYYAVLRAVAERRTPKPFSYLTTPPGTI
jgi:hypothetical protein